MGQKPLRHHDEIHVHCVKHNRYDCFHFLCYFFILTYSTTLLNHGWFNKSVVSSFITVVDCILRKSGERNQRNNSLLVSTCVINKNHSYGARTIQIEGREEVNGGWCKFRQCYVLAGKRVSGIVELDEGVFFCGV